MGCRFEPVIDPLNKSLLTYLDNIRVRLGQIRGMEFGRKQFKVNEVETLPNGELHFKTIPTKRSTPPSLMKKGLKLPSGSPCTT